MRGYVHRGHVLRGFVHEGLCPTLSASDDEVFLRYRTKHSIALLSCAYYGTVIIHNSTDYMTVRIYKKNDLYGCCTIRYSLGLRL